MMEKLVQPGEGGGCTAHPLSLSCTLYNVVVYAPAEGADTLPLFLLYPPYVLCGYRLAWRIIDDMG